MKPIRIHELLEALRDNKIVVLATTFTSFISLLVFTAGIVYPYLNDVLPLSKSTPWGIITSIFLHTNFTHLSANLIGFLVYAFFIIAPDGLLNRYQIKERLKFFLPVVLGSAILVNILWLIVAPESNSRGASGMVFAMGGVALGMSLMNILKLFSGFRTLSQHFKKRRLILALMVNVIIAVPIIVLTVFYSSYFLGVGPGVNVFAHGVAFLLAFFFVMMNEMRREYIPYIRVTFRNLKSRKNKQ